MLATHRKAYAMQNHGISKPVLWASAGAAVFFAILFSHGYIWFTSGKAETLASQRATSAVITALAPVCVDNFTRAPNAEANLAALKKINSEYQQAEFIDKGSWATIPRSEKKGS